MKPIPQPSVRDYFIVFAALLALLATTVAFSFVHLGIGNPIIALAIAFAKMLLIILFFMHVWFSHRLVWVVACAGFFWLGILMVLAMSDYLSRGWMPR